FGAAVGYVAYRLLKSIDDTTPAIGQTVTFTIVVTNSGPDIATGVQITDAVPSGFGSITNVSGGATLVGNTLTWSNKTIPVDGTLTFTFQAVVIAGQTVPTSYTNWARVTDSDQWDPDSTPDPTSTTEDDDDDAPLVISDLWLDKSVSDPTPNVGDTVTFSIVVHNDGPADVTGVAVKDVVPSGYSGITAINGGGLLSGSTITWSNLSITSGSFATLTFQAIVDAPTATPSEYLNTAEISASDNFDPDSTPNNNVPSEDDQDTASVSPQVIDVSLVKSISNPTPEIGETVTFTLLVANGGPATATNITVADLVPSGYSYVVGSIAGGTSRSGATPTTGSGLTWTIASLASGANTSLTFQAVVLLTGSYTNYAQITSHTQYDTDSTPGNGQQTPDEDDDSQVTPTPITGTVTGHLYFDRNGDGSQDADGVDNIPGNSDDEVNLANVDVVITPRFGAPFTVSSNASGDWSAVVPTGATTANVDETDPQFTTVIPTGWIQTDGADPTTVTAVGGATVSAGNDGYYLPPALVGNRVWLDENSDGLQNAGEDGIAGLTVAINGTDVYGNSISYTTLTGVDGGYLFRVPAGTYTITVNGGTTPSGMNPTFDPDGTL
ncbi:MAG TPA: SdrD B-like domain-containing protein, partial [Pirellulaceae bacterium]|nr:SdrD B-like domain-containing protein [Pirellulaceae bacterium]